MTMTADEFKKLNPEAREKVLSGLRLEKEYKALPSEDRTQINTLLKAQQEKPMTKSEAVRRATGQGLSFGWADELAAGLSAAGQKFLGSADLEPAFDKALEAQQARDKLAQAKFPELFSNIEMGAAAALTVLPVAGLGVKGFKAAKGLAGSVGKAKKAREGLRLAKKFGSGVPAAKDSVILAIKEARAAKEVVGKTAGLGKGVLKGITGAGKSAVGGAATSLGKAEEKTLDAAKKGAFIGGVTGTGASLLGPALRGAGKLVGRNIGSVAKGASIGTFGFVKTALGQQAIKNMSKAAVEKSPRLAKTLEGIGSLSKTALKGGETFVNVLAEAFEKQGGAGLVETHRQLLKDPGYVEFLDKVEKQQQGLRPPTRGKK